jgi:hypothetical protein
MRGFDSPAPLQVKSDDGYCVVSLGGSEAGGPAIGFLPTSDYNLSRAPQQQHQLAAGGRMLPFPYAPPYLAFLR